MRDKVIPSLMQVPLGIWTVVTPVLFVFFHVAPATWNHVIVGLAVVALALARGVGNQGPWASWASMALGLWLVASPWALGYAYTDAYANPGLLAANDVVTGGLIAALAAWSALLARDARERYALSQGAVFASAMPDEHERHRHPPHDRHPHGH